MRRLTVNAYEVVLVYKMGALVRVLTKGKYWLGWNETIEHFSMSLPFFPKKNIDILLKDERLKSLLDIIEVKDNELGFQYKNGNFRRVYGPGRYIFWKETKDYEFEIHDLNNDEVPESVERKILHKAEVLQYLKVQVVESYEKGLLFIDGKYEKAIGPGVYYFWKNDRAISIMKTDLRKQMMEVSGQELLTKDKAAIRLNFYANYQINDLEKAIVETKDFAKQLYIQLQLALRAYVGTQTLDMLLANKDAIAPFVIDVVKTKAEAMGIVLHSAGIRDVILPGEVKEIMNQVLVAEKKAQANVIMRREETASTRSLLNTAKLMEDNDMLYRLKEMEFIEKIAENIETISLNNGGGVIDELKGLFGAAK